MATKSYEVLADELTLLRKINDLTHPTTGDVIGVVQGKGYIAYKGDVVSADDVSPALLEAVEDENHPSHKSVSRKLKPVNAEPKSALVVQGAPFPGYDDMEEEDVIAALRNLPSAAAQAVKAYERENENRDRIVHFNIGWGQAPGDREEGLIGGNAQDPDLTQPVADMQLREVPDEGPVQRGEGITGTGDPQVAPGTAAAEEEDAEKDGPRPRPRNRRQRKSENASDASTPAKSDDKGGKDE